MVSAPSHRSNRPVPVGQAPAFREIPHIHDSLPVADILPQVPAVQFWAILLVSYFFRKTSNVLFHRRHSLAAERKRFGLFLIFAELLHGVLSLVRTKQSPGPCSDRGLYARCASINLNRNSLRKRTNSPIPAPRDREARRGPNGARLLHSPKDPAMA